MLADFVGRVPPRVIIKAVRQLPVNAREWPARSGALAEWLMIGANSFHALSDQHGSIPTENSLAWADQHTFPNPESRLGPAGSWFALLTMGGAVEMLKGVAELYGSAASSPLTRAHIPVIRSLQEHLGRVVWLCEPAFSNASESKEDDSWELRHFRSILIAREWVDDWVKHLNLNDPDGSDIVVARAEQVKVLAQTNSAADRLDVTIGQAWPSYTAFAELIEVVSDSFHAAQRDVPTKAPYKRLSETSHGGLFGLHGDKSITGGGVYRFEQDNASLDVMASRVAWWWTTAMSMLGVYYGWDAETTLKPFTELWQALYE